MTATGLRVCTQCAHLNPANSRYCNQCGKSIESGPEPTHYTPRHLSEKILNSRSAMEGERKQVTVLFADIKGSVALSQKVEAERWHHIMDRFFGILTECVHDYEGSINQYTGDGVMALFGAPIAHEDHAVRACRAALAIRRRLVALSAELKQQEGLDFAARQGLNSGEVVVGRIGDDLRMDYTAQGQTVGLAARMEQLALSNGILISRFTRDLVAADFHLKERSALTVKGFDDRVRTYELVDAAQRSAPAEQAHVLVGRDRELSLLESYRHKVEETACGMMVTISAETGLGKSRLCREFSRQCQDAGIRSYVIRGSSHHRVEAEQPLQQLFSALLELPDRDDETFETVLLQAVDAHRPLPQRLVDNLYSLFGVNAGHAQVVESHRQLELSMQLALRLLHEGVLKQHAVFIIENLHWLDDPRAAAFLDAAVDSVPHLPVLFVVTARQDYQFRWQHQSFLRRMNLRPLSDADSHILLDDMLGSSEQLSGLKFEIAQRAGGNPMFMDELVRQLFEKGVLSRDSRGVKLKKTSETVQLPPSVQAVVAARIDSLSEGGKRLLQFAAVIGRRIPFDLLREVYEFEDFDVCLAQLQDQGFLHREVSAQQALLFSQALFQDVAYGALLGEQRRAIHLRVARALQAMHTISSGLRLARHLAAAGHAEEAAQCYLDMADGYARHDVPEAQRCLKLAADALAQLPSSEAQRNASIKVLARQLRMGMRASLDSQALSALREQGEAWLELGVDDAAQGLFLLGCGSAYLANGEHAEATMCFQQALELTESQSGHQLAASVPVCFSSLILGDLDSAEHQAVAALSLLHQLGPESSEVAEADAWLNASCLVALQLIQAWTLLWKGQVLAATQLLALARQNAEGQVYGEQTVMALSASAFVAAISGDADSALEHAQQAVRLAHSMQNTTAELISQMALGHSLLRQNKSLDALTVLEEAIARFARAGLGLGELARLEVDSSLAHLASGDARKARDLAAQALERAQALGNPIIEIEARLAQLRAGLFSSKPLGFLKRYRSTLDEVELAIASLGVDLLKPDLLLLQARWLDLRGEAEQAQELHEEAVALLLELGIAPPVLIH
ncbi:MAG: adenylate/guanylate cyclase domain-containing protein [Oceanococcus sp.]